MNCIIIDDDKVAQKAIQFLISKVPSLILSGIYDNPLESLQSIDKKEVDLIFLDIEMPEVSGLDFLKNFGNLPQVVVCSSKKEYAADVYEYNVTDYLVKPISYERFAKAIHKTKDVHDNFKFNGIRDDSFFIKNKGNYLNVNSKDILYFEALSDYVNIYTHAAKYTIYSTMRAIEAKLPNTEFVRIHRSYIVRIDKIAFIEEGNVFVKETPLPISKSYKKELNNRLNFL